MHVLTNTIIVLILILAPSAATTGEIDAPQTGYFRVSITPVEMLGEQGAEALSGVFAKDDNLSWQLDVPGNYDASNPPGLVVFINRASWGGGKKAWSDVLREKNLILVGAIDAGDKSPANERMLKAVLAPTLVGGRYALDVERIYVAGFVGGAQVANILATTKPELFRGGLFLSGGKSWGDKPPLKIDAVRKNRYVFLAGGNDISRIKVARVAAAYKEAGVTNTELIIVPNTRQELPGPSYFATAIDYLDSRN